MILAKGKRLDRRKQATLGEKKSTDEIRRLERLFAQVAGERRAALDRHEDRQDPDPQVKIIYH